MGRSHAGADPCVDRRSLRSSRLLTLPALTHCWCSLPARCRVCLLACCTFHCPGRIPSRHQPAETRFCDKTSALNQHFEAPEGLVVPSGTRHAAAGCLFGT